MLYARFFGNDFVSDDKIVIVQNPDIGSLEWALFSTPFTFLRNLQLHIIYTFFKLSQAPYHALNLLYHLGTIVLFFVLLMKMKYSFIVAAVATALFGLHPVQVEAVGWISGGPYPQYTFFLLCSFVLFLRSGTLTAIFSTVFFILALFSSHMALVFPLILGLYSFCFQQKTLFKKALLVGVLPMLIFGTYYLLSLNNRISSTQTSGLVEGVFVNPLITFPVQLTSYLHMLTWPYKLSFYHTDFNVSMLAVFFRGSIVVLYFLFLLFAFRRNKKLFFWAVLFLAGLIPTMLPVMIAWTVAERYVYFSSLGFFVLYACGIEYIYKKLHSIKLHSIVYFVLFLILLAYAVRGQIRLSDWKDADTLWLATAKTDKLSPQNHNNLGALYAKRGNYQRSIVEFETALTLKPGYSDAQHNLGVTYMEMKDYQRALEAFKKAIEINPNIWQSHQFIAAIYFKQKNLVMAQKHIEKALQINPDNQALLYNLQQIKAQMPSK